MTALTCFRCGDTRELDDVLCEDGSTLTVRQYLGLLEETGLVPLCTRCAEQVSR